MLDANKLRETLRFIQGFLPQHGVYVVYEDEAERRTGVPGKGIQTAIVPVYVSVSQRSNVLDIRVTKPGGAFDPDLTSEALGYAEQILEQFR